VFSKTLFFSHPRRKNKLRSQKSHSLPGGIFILNITEVLMFSVQEGFLSNE
jgi:hypothetical protein